MKAVQSVEVVAVRLQRLAGSNVQGTEDLLSCVHLVNMCRTVNMCRQFGRVCLLPAHSLNWGS